MLGRSVWLGTGSAREGSDERRSAAAAGERDKFDVGFGVVVSKVVEFDGDRSERYRDPEEDGRSELLTYDFMNNCFLLFKLRRLIMSNEI